MKRAKQFSGVSPGFTLVELMAAIAIALVLLIGIGMVFRTAGDAIETGQALGETARDNRGLFETMNQDFANIADDGPVFAIVNYQNNGYTDQNDYYTANTTTGNNGNGTKLSPSLMYFDPTHSGNPQEVIPALYNAYSHRMDTISFFARGNYTRQIQVNPQNPANTTVLMDTSQQNSSVEAWITYGLMAMADNTLAGTPNYKIPAQGTPQTNPNNAYGVQWTIGRSCILLRPDADKDSANNYLIAASANDPTQGNPSAPLFPLAWNSQDATGGGNTIESGLTDMAKTSIAGFAQQVYGQFNFYNGYAVPPGSWSNFAESNTVDATLVRMAWNWNAGPNTPFSPRIFNGRNWYAKPLTGLQMSQMAFNLAPGVSQFIVEYAGDYLNQDPTTGNVIYVYGMNGTFNSNVGTNSGSGKTTDPKIQYSPRWGATDGQVDFIVDSQPGGGTTRRIRWYGMPRDVAGDPNTNGPCAHIVSLGQSPNGPNVPGSYIPGVVPLRDLLAAGPASPPPPFYDSDDQFYYQFKGGGFNSHAPFEFFTDDAGLDGGTGTSIPADYAAPGGSGMQNNGKYVCIWGPTDPRPKMIRITIVLNDPHRRLHDGQTLEYIFNVP